MSIALGNNKPDALLEVETILWRALFAISDGLQFPEDIVEQSVAQIPWEKLKLDSAQWNWFDLSPPPLPPIAAGLLTQIAHPVSTPLALPLPNLMDITPNHGVQVSFRHLDEMDTDRNELCSTDKLTGERGLCGTMGKEFHGHPESSFEEDDGPPGLQSYSTTRDDVAHPEAPEPLSETMIMGKSACLTSGAKETSEEDGAHCESELSSVREDPEICTARRSSRLSSKDKPVEGGPEHVVLPTSGTGRSSSPRKRKGKVTKPKQMSPENLSQPGSPRPPVAMKLALKRKVPPEVEALLSEGSSAAKPIDVDALNAVLERFPVKRELQVCDFKMPTSKRLIFFFSM